MKILGLDPGKSRDAFAAVGIEIKDEQIHVRLAQRWTGRKYTEVVDKVIGLNIRHNFDHIILELNNTGQVVKELFDMKRVVVIPVTTTGELKDIKKKMEIKTMDKNEMVRWFMKAKNELHIIKFPKQYNKEFSELDRQISIFAEHRTESGKSFNYYAPGDEHDDYVMALLLACHLARYYLKRPNQLASVASKKVHMNNDDIYGTAVPPNATIKTRYILGN